MCRTCGRIRPSKRYAGKWISSAGTEELARWPHVGASLLAKNSQAPRLFRKCASSLTFFASKLAPTEDERAMLRD
ncbi:hypothetical protein B4O85_07260 [Pseudomonas azotoformans]|uniref:Uncharacterized protein n=1 Tax=Pseudomonas azotoformans TaxID=47878 RepID=A0A4Q0HX54_PSEAZ|nr:hypothetical protein B4O85_07260 [Pseudomonas azotoformans]